MAERTIAIGDIHGYLTALDAILKLVAPTPDDTLVMLGDFVDRGPNSRGVLDRLIELGRQCHLVTILGNHDEMMRDVCRGHVELLGNWLMFGGEATLASYDGRLPDGLPLAHRELLDGCQRAFETETHFFTHANYYSNLPLHRQPSEALRWESLRDRRPFPHMSGKIAIVGHTAQKDGEVLDLGYLKCLDTWIYGDGWLTAMDVATEEIWQVDKNGKPRRKKNRQ